MVSSAVGNAQPVGGFQRHGDGYAYGVVDPFARRLADQTSGMANGTNGAHCKSSAALECRRGKCTSRPRRRSLSARWGLPFFECGPPRHREGFGILATALA